MHRVRGARVIPRRSSERGTTIIMLHQLLPQLHQRLPECHPTPNLNPSHLRLPLSNLFLRIMNRNRLVPEGMQPLRREDGRNQPRRGARDPRRVRVLLREVQVLLVRAQEALLREFSSFISVGVFGKIEKLKFTWISSLTVSQMRRRISWTWSMRIQRSQHLQASVP